jgi:hypothetical protein
MRPIPVPQQALTFRQLGLGDDEADDIIVPSTVLDSGFPFWKYVLLSVTAGLITHGLIRAWDAKKRKRLGSPAQAVLLPPIVVPPAPIKALPPLRRSKKSARRKRR